MNKTNKILTGLLVFLVISLIGFIVVLEFVKDNYLLIELNGNESIKINISEKYTELGVRAKLGSVDLSKNVKIKGNVNTNKAGIYKIIYFIDYNKMQKQVERNVEVIDNIAPKLTLLGSNPLIIYQGNNNYTEYGYRAIDNSDGLINDKVKIVNNVNTNIKGNYEVLYEVSDNSGNKTQVVRKVQVIQVCKKRRSIPILMYHRFYDSRLKEKLVDHNFFDVVKFEKQLDYLMKNNYYFPTWKEVADFIDHKIYLPAKSIVLSADDGSPSFFSRAMPLVEKYKAHMTSFVITNKKHLNEPFLRATESEHIEFQSHSHAMHVRACKGKGKLLCSSFKRGLEDLLISIRIIGSNDAFAYPFGTTSTNIYTVVKKAGFKVAVTTIGGRAYVGSDRLLLPRVRISTDTSFEYFKRMLAKT